MGPESRMQAPRNTTLSTHNAQDAARAAAQVLLSACEVVGISPIECLARNKLPVQLSSASEVNAVGPLVGESIVFTGAMTMGRSQAHAMAAVLGCAPSNTVSRKTTILIVGDQDISRLGGKKKSSKHLKAEELNETGQEIRTRSE